MLALLCAFEIRHAPMKSREKNVYFVSLSEFSKANLKNSVKFSFFIDHWFSVTRKDDIEKGIFIFFIVMRHFSVFTWQIVFKSGWIERSITR